MMSLEALHKCVLQGGGKKTKFISVVPAGDGVVDWRKRSKGSGKE